MYREILVQAADEETQVAVLEDGKLAEIYVEQMPSQRQVGNIYKGIVKNVLPGMQAAFVDIGLEKNAFLYVEDALTDKIGQQDRMKNGVNPHIRDIVKEGQQLVVQVAKEPTGTKGARVTTQISLPGRYLVLMPTMDYIGISRRIENEAERERLKSVAEAIKPPEMGLIIRTVAEGAEREDLEQDVANLLSIWQRVKKQGERVAGPALIHKDLELVQRILRDVFTEDTRKLSVNSRQVFERVNEFLDVCDVSLKGKVYLSDTENLFKKYDVYHEMEQALNRKVWLKSGGYLIIDQMEALTAIDVNTGKFVGSTDLADTVLKTNIEAAREIARQLRLRNIGGIIIIDFIDMQSPVHKLEILQTLEEELKKDKVKAHILGITPLGLVEMTRKKVRQSLSSILERNCPFCEAKGRILSENTAFLLLKKELKEMAERGTVDTFVVEVHPQLATLVTGVGGSTQEELEEKLGIKIIVKGRGHIHPAKYVIRPVADSFDLLSQLPVEEGQIIKATIEQEQPDSPQDAVAFAGGYLLRVENGAEWIGQTVFLEIGKVFRTYAKAKVIRKVM
jgi:ribonuclease G